MYDYDLFAAASWPQAVSTGSAGTKAASATGVSWTRPSPALEGPVRAYLAGAYTLEDFNYSIKQSVHPYGYLQGYRYNASNTVPTADRTDFTGVCAACPSATMSAASVGMAGGWSNGRTYGMSFSTQTAECTDFATVTTFLCEQAKPNPSINQQYNYCAGFTDHSLYGYLCGGAVGGAYSTINRIDFATITSDLAFSSNLTMARMRQAGWSDTGTYGYNQGGVAEPSASVIIVTNAADQLDFVTGLCYAAPLANLPSAVTAAVGWTDVLAYGFALGGYIMSDGYIYDFAPSRTDFASGVCASCPSAGLSTGRALGGAWSDGTLYGYLQAGVVFTGSYNYLTISDRIDHATHTTARYSIADASWAYSFGAAVGWSGGCS